jgi:flavin prenyltransferase
MDKEKAIILGISGASGIVYGMKTLEWLLSNDYRVDLIISENAFYIAKQELGLELPHDKEIVKKNLAKFLKLNEKENRLEIYFNNELWAGPSSGSYDSKLMLICPSSMGTVAAIASGLSQNLIQRCADVMIKENKPLIIVPRETPLSAIHLENMLKLAKAGVKIVPPLVGFYSKIDSLEDAINFVVGKILNACNLENNLYKRWHP